MWGGTLRESVVCICRLYLFVSVVCICRLYLSGGGGGEADLSLKSNNPTLKGGEKSAKICESV